MQDKFSKIQLVSATAFFIFSCFMFFFLYRQIELNSYKSETVLNSWGQETQRRAEITSLNYSMKSIDGEIKQLNQHFISSSDVVPFLNTVEGWGPKVNVNVEILSVDASSDNKELNVVINASGSFEGVYKFLNLLENSPYEINIYFLDLKKKEDFNVSDSNKKINSNPKWELDLKIKLLSFVP